jgi:D-glycero-D-manno-heptose 1,7-bisphosphate phosphatase
MNKAVFLDRDGVINLEIGDYIKRKEDFKLLPHAVRYIAALHQKGVKIIVVTNQGGIAKGFYNQAQLTEMHDMMLKAVEAAGGKITEVYYCPHHPDFGLCLCRKPGSLLAQKAASKHHIDVTQSIFIGDKQRDVECAEGAGIKGFLIEENEDWGRLVDSFLSE